MDLPTLVQTAQQGDHQAFGQIVHRFQDMAYAYAYSIVGDNGLAQDAAQEAFVDAYQSLANLREPAAFPGWFRRIVLKHSDRQIRGKRATFVELEQAGPLGSMSLDPARLMDEALFRGDVHAAIELLPPNQRSVTTLFYVEGYSYNEIASFLEVSVSAVKKRLFNARKNLKERMIPMVSEKLQSDKPSQDETFANQVLFFTAVLDNKVDAVRQLIQKDATLLEATPEWKMAIKRQYWIGSSALDLAVGYGYAEMTELLLGLGANINATNRSRMTPLHTAAIMGRPEQVATLLTAGANVDAQSAQAQTPLHVAAIRNRGEVVKGLLEGGADVGPADQQGRTPVEWAALLGHQAVVDQLVASGAAQPTVQRLIPPAAGHPQLLQTGMKIIDLCAPLKRGGINGIFTPYSGVGFMVAIGQIARSVQKIHNGAVVFACINTDHPHQEFWHVHLREADADQELTYVYEQSTGDPTQPLTLIEKALHVLRDKAAGDREVLLVLDGRLATAPDVLTTVRNELGQLSNATALVYGHHTVGVLPSTLTDLDSVLTFSMERAKAGLYAAIDPVRSTSSLFDAELAGTTHAQVVERVRRLMTRYGELRFPYDAGGPETLWYIDDDPNLEETLIRGRRIDRFLTQPLFGLEPWTGTIGQYVSLSDTVKGCEDILDGKYDEVDEEKFLFIGAIDMVKTK